MSNNVLHKQENFKDIPTGGICWIKRRALRNRTWRMLSVKPSDLVRERRREAEFIQLYQKWCGFVSSFERSPALAAAGCERVRQL